jgi:hypothetical protein
MYSNHLGQERMPNKAIVGSETLEGVTMVRYDHPPQRFADPATCFVPHAMTSILDAKWDISSHNWVCNIITAPWPLAYPLC